MSSSAPPITPDLAPDDLVGRIEDPRLRARALAVLASLDVEQRAAALSDGPTLVLGAAGTGKSRVLAHRLAWLCAGLRVPPRRVLLLARSERDAEVVRARAQRLLVFPLHGAWIGTFHDVCQRILRAHAAALGRRSTFAVLDAADARALVRRAARDVKADPDGFPAKRVQEQIAVHKAARTTPDDVLGDIYRAYEALLAEANAFDAEDLLRHVAGLLEDDADLRAKYRRRFEHILVDGWEDATPPQRELVRLLGAPDGQVLVVADPAEALAAEPTPAGTFLADFPAARTLSLRHAYRQAGRIRHVAERVLLRGQGPNGPGSEPHPPAADMRKKGTRVVSVTVADELEEAAIVVAWLQRLARKTGAPLGRVGILTRSPILARPFEEALVRAGVPYRVVGGPRFYERKEIKDVLAYLRLTLHGGDPAALGRIANVPRRGIGPASVRTIGRLSRDRKGDRRVTLAEAALRAASLPRVTAQRAGALADLGRLLQDLDEAARDHGIAELIDYVVERSGYGRHLMELSHPEEETRRQGIDELRGLARPFAGPAAEALPAFFDRVALVSGAPWVADHEPEEPEVEPMRREDNEAGVQLLTCAEAKGRDYEILFLTGMEEGLLPAAEPASLAAERRLAYVALSRARTRLILSHALSRTLYGLPRSGEPSRFLHDAGRRVRHYRLGKARRPAAHPTTLAQVRTGQRVSHPRYGIGHVASVDGQMVTVRFESGVEKRFSLAFARLQPG